MFVFAITSAWLALLQAFLAKRLPREQLGRAAASSRLPVHTVTVTTWRRGHHEE